MATKLVLQLVICAALARLAKEFFVHFIVLYLGWDSPFLHILKFYSTHRKSAKYNADDGLANRLEDPYRPALREKTRLLANELLIANVQDRPRTQDKPVLQCDVEATRQVGGPTLPATDACTLTTEWKDPIPFDAPPDSEESSSIHSGSPVTVRAIKKARRRRNISSAKVAKPLNHEEPPSAVCGATASPFCLNDASLDAIFEHTGLDESQIFQHLLPMCCNAETRILNGFPYETKQGSFIFKPPSGISSLNVALAGKQLVSAETQDVYVETEDCQVQESSPKKQQNSNSPQQPAYAVSPLNLMCRRCLKKFDKGTNGSELCKFHPGKTSLRQDGTLRYTCCNLVKNSEACSSNKYHVYHHLSTGLNGPLDGFKSCQNKKRRKKVFGLDCEMIFTDHGFEVARVTLVNLRGVAVFDCYVQPLGNIYDYNTRFSGIVAKDLHKAISFKKMRNILLNHIGQYDIIVGHSVESDLQVLKLFHRRVIDTSVLFSELRGGIAYKKSLKYLAKQFLKKDVQQSTEGHNSIEDAGTAVSIILAAVILETPESK